jgi:hypothetical protein
VARLLRAIVGVGGLDAPAARERVRSRVPEAHPEDVLLFDDLLRIADPDVALPTIDPDARRRRLTALVNAASLARHAPTVYVIEDAHWIDEVSESMLAEFFTVMAQTPSLVLVTYRPEYRGALSRVPGTHTVALAPLSDSEATTLVSGLLGSNPSVGGVAAMITEKAAGNPFFVEEMVRDLAQRGVLWGTRGAYELTGDVGEVSVPATLQATIAARIDRLDPAAKRTLSAAPVIGTKFSRDLVETLGIDPDLQDLLSGQFIEQIGFTGQPEFVFHHPLIRAVAYESQLISDRAELHRRVAAAIESRDPAMAEENAALLAEHLESAGDVHAAYDWHMRAATWATNRDIGAARLSWTAHGRSPMHCPPMTSTGRPCALIPSLMRTSGTAIARWRKRLASKGIWRGPRRCHDGDHADEQIIGGERAPSLGIWMPGAHVQPDCEHQEVDEHHHHAGPGTAVADQDDTQRCRDGGPAVRGNLVFAGSERRGDDRRREVPVLVSLRRPDCGAADRQCHGRTRCAPLTRRRHFPA